MITVILNGYKRPENLNEQLEALKNQTVKPDEILFWYNNPGDNDLINTILVQKFLLRIVTITLVFGQDLLSHLWQKTLMYVYSMMTQFLVRNG
jgi:hypothetical protein